MTRKLATTALALALVAPLASSALAQEKPAPPAQQRAAMVPVKLDLAISRQAGEKKISSMPYTMWLTANSTAREGSTSLRMGVQVPVSTMVMASPSDGEPATRSYNYRPVGTNIDASASSAADGRYFVAITLNDSGLQTTKLDSAVDGVPMFREFTSRFYLLLRDGQTATYTSATDPVTGETLDVQVTLSVLK